MQGASTNSGMGVSNLQRSKKRSSKVLLCASDLIQSQRFIFIVGQVVPFPLFYTVVQWIEQSLVGKELLLFLRRNEAPASWLEAHIANRPRGKRAARIPDAAIHHWPRNAHGKQDELHSWLSKHFCLILQSLRLDVMLLGRYLRLRQKTGLFKKSTQNASFTSLGVFLAKTFFRLWCQTLNGMDKPMTVTEAGILMWTLMFQSFVCTDGCWELRWALSGSDSRIRTKAEFQPLAMDSEDLREDTILRWLKWRVCKVSW